jgi:cytochrome c oxidase subunit 2
MKGRAATLMGLGILGVIPASAAWAGDMKIPADGWDILWHHVVIDLTVIGVVFLAAAIFMMIKYRAKSPTDVGTARKLTKIQAIGWALIPAFLFMADDFFMAAKGWSLWNTYRNVPEGAMEVKVTASMWSWQFEYDNGVTTTFDVDSKEGDGLMVPVGRPVVLRMTSNDVVHSFSMAKYRVKEDVMPGRITYLWFYPKEKAESSVTCQEFCGTRHAYMYAPVKAVPQDAFDAWLKKKKDEA